MERFHRRNSRARRITLWLIWSVLVLSITLGSAALTERHISHERHAQQTSDIIHSHAQQIQRSNYGIVQKALTGIAHLQPIKDTLQGLSEPDNQLVLTTLETARSALDANIVYLINPQGLTLACTPLSNSRTLTGNNYYFRPYVRNALANAKSQFYAAIGVTTGTRGLFVSVPVRHHGQISGVLVAKLGIDQLEGYFAEEKTPILMASADGVIFASNRRDWLYRTVLPITAQRRMQLRQSQQFADQALEPSGFDFTQPELFMGKTRYLIKKTAVMDGNWHLYALVQPAAFQANPFLLTSVPVFIALMILTYLFLVYKKLSDSQTRRRQLGEQSRMVHWEVDNRGLLTYISQVSASVLGYQPQELIGEKYLYELVPESDRTHFRRQSLLLFAQKKDFQNLEHLMLNKHGTSFWTALNGIPIVDEQRKIVGFRGTLIDIDQRKNLEIRLQKEHDLFSSGPVMTIVWHAEENWPITHISENCAAFLGYTRAEMTAADFRFTELLHPEDVVPVTTEVTDAVDSHAEHFTHKPYRLKHRNGNNIYVYDHTRIIRNDLGEVTEFHGYLVDISNTVRISQELENQQQRLAMTIEGASLGTWDWDIVSGKVIFNQRWAKMLGYSLEDIKPHVSAWETLLHPDEKAKVERQLSDHLTGKTATYRCEHRLRHRSGEWIWVLDVGRVLKRSKTGEPLRAAGIHIDITEQKNSEEQLRASNERIQTLMNSLQAGVILIREKDRRIVEANPAAERMVGVSAGGMLGKKCHQFLCPSQEGKCPVFDQGQVLDNSERSMITAEGSTLPVLKNAAILELDGERHLLESFVDIKKLKIAEKNLAYQTSVAQELARKADSANRAKSEFLANMSHEIRTPLNGIIGMGHLLLDTELNAEQQKLAETVQSSSTVLLNLINDILDFSKIEAGKLDLEQIDFDVYRLMNDCTETLRFKAEEKNLRLTTHITPDVPRWVCGDPGRLRQVLTNLINNAIKFTEQGEINCRIELESQSSDQTVLKFSVEDTGIGIPQDKARKLFEAFEQADTSTTRKFGGTGLGLSISQQLVKMMHGRIGLDSIEGKGSTFWFNGRFKKTDVQVDNLVHLDPAALNDVRVLVVDNNTTNQEVLAQQLTSWNLRVSLAEEGPEALQLLYQGIEEQDPFKLATIDMQIPGMDGETLGRAIKMAPELSETAIVILTSMGMRGDGRHFTGIGFDAYLTKPYLPDELKNILIKMVEPESALKPQITTRHDVPIPKQFHGHLLLV
ncbi:MAG: PAS domain S-box protein [Desulfuromonadales bacterium]|nr:PAS domain S-box protein [Desulfuromonadales bacterium]MBN2791570.1 PAS domain S-box protein [Desulfuromonadales bacterium]